MQARAFGAGGTAADLSDGQAPSVQAVRPSGFVRRGDGARMDLEATIRACDEAGDRRGAAEARLALGSMMLEEAADPRARTLLEDAGVLFEELGDETRASLAMARLEEALAVIEESPRSFSAIYLPWQGMRESGD